MAISTFNSSMSRDTVPLQAGHVMVIDLVGQSNQWGTNSDISDVTNNVYGGNEDLISIWDKIATGTALDPIDDGDWAPMDANWGRGGSGIIGPELSLCRRLIQAWRPTHLYVIKCCRGETALAQHAEADAAGMDWNPRTASPYSMYQVWKHGYHIPAIASIKAIHGESRVWHGGVFWLQGASDARDGDNNEVNDITDSEYGVEAHAAYFRNLTEILTKFRQDAGSGVPLIVGQSENYHESASQAQIDDNFFIENVRHQQRLAVAEFSDCALAINDNVTIDGHELFPYSDNEHWTGEGQIHSGESQAGAAIQINNPYFLGGGGGPGS